MEGTTERRAGTAWGPIVRVALEQLLPQEQRVVHDAVAYRLLPPLLKGLVTLCRIGLLRRMLLGAEDSKAPGVTGGILCRKRYIDDRLREALTGGIGPVVILGAGFDTCAYRIPQAASRQVYEVDLPQNVRAKQQALQRLFGIVPKHVTLVPTDFDTQGLQAALVQTGYSAVQPSFFIWEGVTQYIAEAAVRKTFEFLRSAAAGSRLVFTYIRKDFIDGRQTYGLDFLYRQTRVKNQLWQFGLEPDGLEALLGGYGWRLLDHVGSAEYQDRYLRPLGREMKVMEIERAVCADRRPGQNR